MPHLRRDVKKLLTIINGQIPTQALSATDIKVVLSNPRYDWGEQFFIAFAISFPEGRKAFEDAAHTFLFSKERDDKKKERSIDDPELNKDLFFAKMASMVNPIASSGDMLFSPVFKRWLKEALNITKDIYHNKKTNKDYIKQLTSEIETQDNHYIAKYAEKQDRIKNIALAENKAIKTASALKDIKKFLKKMEKNVLTSTTQNILSNDVDSSPLYKVCFLLHKYEGGIVLAKDLYEKCKLAKKAKRKEQKNIAKEMITHLLAFHQDFSSFPLNQYDTKQADILFEHIHCIIKSLGFQVDPQHTEVRDHRSFSLFSYFKNNPAKLFHKNSDMYPASEEATNDILSIPYSEGGPDSSISEHSSSDLSTSTNSSINSRGSGSSPQHSIVSLPDVESPSFMPIRKTFLMPIRSTTRPLPTPPSSSLSSYFNPTHKTADAMMGHYIHKMHYTTRHLEMEQTAEPIPAIDEIKTLLNSLLQQHQVGSVLVETMKDILKVLYVREMLIALISHIDSAGASQENTKMLDEIKRLNEKMSPKIMAHLNLLIQNIEAQQHMTKIIEETEKSKNQMDTSVKDEFSIIIYYTLTKILTLISLDHEKQKEEVIMATLDDIRQDFIDFIKITTNLMFIKGMLQQDVFNETCHHILQRLKLITPMILSMPIHGKDYWEYFADILEKITESRASTKELQDEEQIQPRIHYPPFNKIIAKILVLLQGFNNKRLTDYFHHVGFNELLSQDFRNSYRIDRLWVLDETNNTYNTYIKCYFAIILPTLIQFLVHIKDLVSKEQQDLTQKEWKRSACSEHCLTSIRRSLSTIEELLKRTNLALPATPSKSNRYTKYYQNQSTIMVFSTVPSPNTKPLYQSQEKKKKTKKFASTNYS
ncbi:MAG: hypothetical protein A3F42_03040 [Gammaproteobacteria bacterium RIFCSPHIGHO2_12_FULL_37_34]|nr:MAG: hypothetical protein A3F42_03040 [Gammaproteobacteria bacterium RIFCSPHIGHO2_12_FULL_37_34]